MVGLSLLNINQENENKINIYRFGVDFYFIIIISILLKIVNFKKRREKKTKYYFFNDKKPQNILPFNENSIFEIKKESNMTIIIKGKNKSNNNKLKENENKKRMNNINNNIIIRNYIIINISILINILYQIKNNIFDLFYFQYSKITLKIRGIGYNNIIGNDNFCKFQGINYLKEVYINGNKQDTIEYKYNFNQTDNFVELIWDDNINSCECMFRKCSNIIEINLSNFDTSQVTAMWSMFNGCSSLTSLDLSNFNTSQVSYMDYMFSGCINLEYINYK